VLTDSSSVVWNASPNLSISPHPITAPDSDVVLSGDLLLSASICLSGSDTEKIRLQILYIPTLFCVENTILHDMVPLKVEWEPVNGNDICTAKHTQNYTLAVIVRPERAS
jgi:hypothetical protein